MKYAIILVVALSAAPSAAQDLSPRAAALTVVPASVAPLCPAKLRPLVGVVVSPPLFFVGMALSAGGSVNLDGGDYSRQQKAVRGVGFVTMGLALAGTIYSAVKFRQAKHPKYVCEPRRNR